jgi:hypothetical protein
VRTELGFERNVFRKLQFSRWKKAHLLPNRPIQLSGETHVSLKREPFGLEAGASSTFFPVRIELVFGRNTSYN